MAVLNIWVSLLDREIKEGDFQLSPRKVWKKLNSWKEKTLSLATKEVLIKSIVQAIPIYTMSVFFLPSSITCSITGLIRNFRWGDDDKHKKICWKAWRDFSSQRARGVWGLGT